ncbi:adenylate/guanylate cyclase domain-containing protein, partial [candidate division FCPU426 bacterium]|nr:adenylate/guanylate cyclase domain-containing protein [candidate division FCPU426 bacterium]
MAAKLHLSRTSSGRTLAAALFILAAVGMFLLLGWMQRLEWLATDWMQRLAAAGKPPHPDFHFIVLDQKSLDAAEAEFGLSWPWPREAYAQVLRFLRHAGARLVVLDFLFSEASLYGPEDDQVLGEAIRQIKNVYLPVITKTAGSASARQHLDRLRPDVFLGLSPPALKGVPVQESLTLPVEVVLKNAAGLGDARLTPDADGVARRIRPFIRLGEKYLPHLSLAPLHLSPVSLQAGRLRWGEKVWPVDDAGNLVVCFPGFWETYPCTSMIDVITSNVAIAENQKPAVDPGLFRDKIVVVGAVAEGLLDLRKTPLDASTPGFFIVAAVYAAALTGRFYNERWHDALTWAFLIILIALGAVWGRQSFGRGLLLLALTLFLYIGGVLWLFWMQAVVCAPVSPLLGCMLAFAASLGIGYQQEQRQKRFIQGAFSQVLSHSVLTNLMRDPSRLQAGGELSELSIYFSDLAGFTQLAEKMNPQHLVEILNMYLGEMVETIVEENEGYVDKFIGDAVMAFWGAPVPVPDHAWRACRSALCNQRKLQALQRRLQDAGFQEALRMRIGIHTGPAVVGMMGSPKKLNYTVIGDPVNLASRLEGANKQFGTSILASWETVAGIQDRIASREVDRIRVKGKQHPTRIFEIMGFADETDAAAVEWLALFQKGTEAYWQRNFKSAIKLFKAVLAVKPQDQPAAVFLKRAAR